MRFRTKGARERARLLHEAEKARVAGRKAEAADLRVRGLALMSRWDRALYDLALHYDSLGRTFYGSYIDALANECIRGCGSPGTFRRVVAEIMGVDDLLAPGMSALVRTARGGKVGETLRAGGDGFGDRDAGATLAGAVQGPP